ncbi:MAG: hypothetical protein CMG63_01565 [Candidatus Marinimicrobia bacterium]|nr:hypothetical protein [Candidatus Neomarinimicrobiota bacterium]
MCLPIEAKLLKPSKDGEKKEILIINGKRRLYYPAEAEGLYYSINGPTRLEFISRYPVLRKKNKSKPYSYSIILNDKDTIIVNHRYKVQKSIKSIQHPKHKYTYSGNYFINLNSGTHKVAIYPDKKLKYPVLMRVLSKEFGAVTNKKQILQPLIHQNSLKIKVGDSDIAYYECTSQYPLKIEANGEKTLRIMSRLQFSASMGQEESYRIKVKEKNKIIGTYYFSTERSSNSFILKRLDKVPGKWRTCEIKVPKGKHNYSIEIPDKHKAVLTRFILY